MSLLARVVANTECMVAWCHEQRVEGADFCGSAGKRHLADYWQHRLQRLPDGTFIGIVGPQVRLAAKDMTVAPA